MSLSPPVPRRSHRAQASEVAPKGCACHTTAKFPLHGHGHPIYYIRSTSSAYALKQPLPPCTSRFVSSYGFPCAQIIQQMQAQGRPHLQNYEPVHQTQELRN